MDFKYADCASGMLNGLIKREEYDFSLLKLMSRIQGKRYNGIVKVL